MRGRELDMGVAVYLVDLWLAADDPKIGTAILDSGEFKDRFERCLERIVADDAQLVLIKFGRGDPDRAVLDQPFVLVHAVCAEIGVADAKHAELAEQAGPYRLSRVFDEQQAGDRGAGGHRSLDGMPRFVPAMHQVGQRRVMPTLCTQEDGPARWRDSVFDAIGVEIVDAV